MKIIIAGGRDFNNYGLLVETVANFLAYIPDIVLSETEFVLGGARGADSLGEKFADEFGFKKKKFIPKWKKPDGSTDRGAGIKRNHLMGDYADCLIAFHDGVSAGTKDMIDYATKKGLIIKVIHYSNDNQKEEAIQY